MQALSKVFQGLETPYSIAVRCYVRIRCCRDFVVFRCSCAAFLRELGCAQCMHERAAFHAISLPESSILDVLAALLHRASSGSFIFLLPSFA